MLCVFGKLATMKTSPLLILSHLYPWMTHRYLGYLGWAPWGKKNLNKSLCSLKQISGIDGAFLSKLILQIYSISSLTPLGEVTLSIGTNGPKTQEHLFESQDTCWCSWATQQYLVCLKNTKKLFVGIGARNYICNAVFFLPHFYPF